MLAPAKINLYLHVVGRRPDGYHLLDSLVVFAEIGDVVTVEPAATLSMRIDGPFAGKLAADDDNLVLRAARGLRDLTGAAEGARITLTKNLPVASGIGGGSADAAATLRALSALWAVSPDRAALAQLALRLGADVPVCLDGKPSFIRKIYYADLDGRNIQEPFRITGTLNKEARDDQERGISATLFSTSLYDDTKVLIESVDPDSGVQKIFELNTKTGDTRTVAVGSENYSYLAEGVDPSSWRGTLTWLEGRAVVELDDGTVLHHDPATDTVTRDDPA